MSAQTWRGLHIIPDDQFGVTVSDTRRPSSLAAGFFFRYMSSICIAYCGHPPNRLGREVQSPTRAEATASLSIDVSLYLLFWRRSNIRGTTTATGGLCMKRNQRFSFRQGHVFAHAGTHGRYEEERIGPRENGNGRIGLEGWEGVKGGEVEIEMTQKGNGKCVMYFGNFLP